MAQKVSDWTAKSQSKVNFKKNIGDEFNFDATLGIRDKNEVLDFKVEVISGENEEEKMKQMSAKSIKDFKCVGTQRGQNFFTPLVMFKHDNEFLGVNKFIGLPVDDWINGQNDLWKLTRDNKIETAGPVLSCLLKKFATALTISHQKDKKPLSFVCDKLYIHENSFKFCDDDGVGGDVVLGLKNDLQEFRKFVELAGNGHLQDENMKLFLELFTPLNDANNTIEDILLHSYLISHSPLFWDKEERFQFATACNHFQKVYGQTFECCIECKQGMYNLSGWSRRISAIRDREISIIYNSHGFTKPCLLIKFIRICQNHQTIKLPFKELDEKFQELFPDGFSKTYGQLVANLSKLPFSKSEFVSTLKFFGLDYSKVVLG